MTSFSGDQIKEEGVIKLCGVCEGQERAVQV